VENRAHVSKRDQFWDQFRGAAVVGRRERARCGGQAAAFDKDGVGPDSKDRNGGMPLWRAAENGHEAVVKLLLDRSRAG
jgi:ankyrin repeat protein